MSRRLRTRSYEEVHGPFAGLLGTAGFHRADAPKAAARPLARRSCQTTRASPRVKRVCALRDREAILDSNLDAEPAAVMSFGVDRLKGVDRRNLAAPALGSAVFVGHAERLSLLALRELVSDCPAALRDFVWALIKGRSRATRTSSRRWNDRSAGFSIAACRCCAGWASSPSDSIDGRQPRSRRPERTSRQRDADDAAGATAVGADAWAM